MEEVLFQTRFFSAIKTENDSNHSSDPNKRIHSLMSEEHLIASTVKHAVPRYEIPELRHESAIHDID